MLIDFHAHFSPRAARSGGIQTPAETELRGDVPVFTANSNLGCIESHLEMMRQTGIDAAVLSSPEGLRGGMEECRRVNESLAELTEGYPQQLAAVAHVVPGAPGWEAELDRCAGSFGFRGVAVPALLCDRPLDDPSLEPLYSRIEELGLYLFVHAPVAPPSYAFREYAAYDLFRSLGREFYLAMAAARLVHGGVLDRHPRLEVLLAHLGGELAAFVGRLSMYENTVYWGLREGSPHARRAARPFRDYLERFFFDTAGFGARPQPLDVALCELPRERLVFGSDFPQHLRTAELVSRALESAEARIGRQMLEENGMRLLGRWAPRQLVAS